MKLMISLFLFGLLATQSSFATCEDGDGLASDAAVRDVGKRYPDLKKQCRGKASQSDDQKDKYVVIVKCTGNRMFIYEVELKEVEDAWCYVKKVTLSVVNG